MHRDSGFSLLEAIVAIAIISASMGLMMQGLAASTRATKLTDDKYFATILARSNIHRVGFEIPLEPSIVRDSENGRRRELEISLIKLEEVGGGPLEIYQIKSRVFWSGAGAERSVELVTARSRKGERVQNEPGQ